MNVASLCERELVTIGADAPLRAAAALMRDQHVGALVVTDGVEAPHAVGIVTDRDLAIEALTGELNPAATSVGQLASVSLVGVPGTATVQEAVALMERRGVRRLLVVGERGNVIGLVSADDLVEAIAAELGGLARALQSGIAREAAARQPPAGRQARPVFLPQGLPGMH